MGLPTQAKQGRIVQVNPCLTGRRETEQQILRLERSLIVNSTTPRYLPRQPLQLLIRNFATRRGREIPMRRSGLKLFTGWLVLSAVAAQAAFIGEVDSDGLDDGVVTYSPNFAFGGDTTDAPASFASPAVGLSGGDSIFGGNGVNFPDTYLYTYTPAIDGDNAALAAGTPLNDDGDFASGSVAGAAGIYRVYATWPLINNTNTVTGGVTKFVLTGGGSPHFAEAIDQNTINGTFDPADGKFYAGGEWVLLGTALLDANTTYTLTQTSTSNTFISMRSAGVMFDYAGASVPEPSAIALAGFALFGFGLQRRPRLGAARRIG